MEAYTDGIDIAKFDGETPENMSNARKLDNILVMESNHPTRKKGKSIRIQRVGNINLFNNPITNKGYLEYEQEANSYQLMVTYNRLLEIKKGLEDVFVF